MRGGEITLRKSCILSDKCYKSSEYIAMLTGEEPDHELTLTEFDKLGLIEWDYPLNEIECIQENEHTVILVKFVSEEEGCDYDYRFCEIDEDLL